MAQQSPVTAMGFLVGGARAGGGGDVADTNYIQAAIDQGMAALAMAQEQQLFDIAVLLLDALLKETLNGFKVELLDDLMDLAEEAQAHWRKFRPYEQALIDEVSQYPLYEPEYSSVTNQFNAIAEDSLAANHDDFLDWLNTRCNESQSLCEDIIWDLAMAAQRADAQAYGMRLEEFKQFAQDAIRFSRQKAVAGLGRGVAGDVLRTMNLIAASKPADIVAAAKGIFGELFSRPPQMPRAQPVPPMATAQYRIDQTMPTMPPITPDPDIQDVKIEMPSNGVPYPEGGA